MKQLEAVVAKVGELKDGEMRQVSVGDTDLLLVKLAGEFHAVGAYCSHYQAPLVKGVLSGERVVCPWHNACFNVKTGEQQELPGLDSLCRYPVRVEAEDVIVNLPENSSQHRTPTMVKSDPADQRTFVVLGAGAAGAHAVEALRIAGYQGRIVMVTQEDRLPYDRTWFSKDYFIGKASKDQMPLRSADFYHHHQIEVLLNKSVVRVEAADKLITFADGNSLAYDAVLIATGGRPRQLEVPGKELQNVFLLRSFADTERIPAIAQSGAKAVVVGSSFIGMEAASGLTQRGVTVTVVSHSSLPFIKILGAEIGQVFQQVHAEQGVVFKLGREVAQIEGDGKVEAVILDDGERLEADLVVIGIGVQPATEFLTGLELDAKDQSVIVNEYLQAADGLYAAGDIARYQDWRTGETQRVEHWRIAAQQGRTAAYNMAGRPTQFRGLPVFWTMQFEFPLRYLGHAKQWDEIIFNGDLQQRQFIAFYVKDDRILAIASSQRDPETAAISELMRLDQMPSPDALRDESLDFTAMVAQVSESQAE